MREALNWPFTNTWRPVDCGGGDVERLRPHGPCAYPWIAQRFTKLDARFRALLTWETFDSGTRPPCADDVQQVSDVDEAVAHGRSDVRGTHCDVGAWSPNGNDREQVDDADDA